MSRFVKNCRPDFIANKGLELDSKLPQFYPANDDYSSTGLDKMTPEIEYWFPKQSPTVFFIPGSTSVDKSAGKFEHFVDKSKYVD
jgi:hypothetical protein